MYNDRADMASLNESLQDPISARRCSEDAIRAIAHLWNDEGKTFWRSTIQRTREASHTEFFPTVSFRCVDALLLTLQEQPEWLSVDFKQQLISVWSPAILQQQLQNIRSSLDISSGGLNIFTLALYVQVLSRIANLPAIATSVLNETRTKLLEAANQLLKHRVLVQSIPSNGSDTQQISTASAALQRTSGAGAEKASPVRTPHPFLIYQTCRALDLARHVLPELKTDENITDAIEFLVVLTRQSIERLIAKQPLGTLNPGDAVALAFCAATLSSVGVSEDLPFILSSIKTCFLYQDNNGCWPLGRVVEQDKDLSSDRIEIATYHVAEVLADALSRCIDMRQCRADSDPVKSFTERLVRAGKYTERSAMRLSTETLPRIGWCSDHAYGNEMIESWSSASVLSFLVSLERLINAERREAILSGFTTLSPSDPDWPNWLRWPNYQVSGETDHDYPVLQYLDQQVIQRINNDPRKLPPTNPRSVSGLLFGPPGTSKTTIVKALADGLGWPLVMLSPGTFIERGLEYIESQARQVFDRLMQLSKAVVLFDECDELFRERKPSSENEQMRGITAFVTASMLPKLQDLHDRGKVVFFICTNNFSSIDSAVKRGGRIDHTIGVGPPDHHARIIIVRTTCNELRADYGAIDGELVARSLASYTERFTRPELQRATRILLQNISRSPLVDVDAEARKVAKRLRPSLTITEHEYEEFIKVRDSYSQPVTEAITK